MRNFTVMLLRPDYVYSRHCSLQDIYVAKVSSTGIQGAIRDARKEVFEVDTADGLEPKCRSDYALIAVFDGHITPLLYGWQE